ncbi:hypothetical protein YUBABA_00540 [Serratia phage vB_SmaM-Yubaba]|nr:hypothetical protein YUBABA_00540 [Serratia phage vB_SmaM-Yubaba]
MSRKKKITGGNPAKRMVVVKHPKAVGDDIPMPPQVETFNFYAADELIKDEEHLGMNYSPFITGVSVPFTGWRLKQNHVLKLKTGEVTRGRPNADAWYLEDGRTVYDPEVATIALIPDGLDRKYSFTGEDRLVRDIEMFGTRYPVYCGETFYHLSQIPEDKKLVILGAWAYKYRSGDKFKIIPVTGMIVDKDDARPGLDELMKYEEADVNLFWRDEDCRLLNNEELIVKIRQYKNLMKIKNEQPEDYAKAEALVIKHGIPEAKRGIYIPYFASQPEDKVLEVYSMIERPLGNEQVFRNPLAGAAKSQRSPYIMGNHAYVQGKIFENV